MATLRELRWRTDREAILAFQTEIYERNFPGFHMTPDFIRDYEQQIRRATRTPGERLLVLEDELGLCGFLWICLISTMVDPLMGYVKNVYVAPRLRGQGHGKQLLEAADAWFQTNGCSKASLDASICNEQAVGLYERVGYEPVRYRMEKTYDDEQPELPGATKW